MPRTHFLRGLLALFVLVASPIATAAESAVDFVLVSKSERRMFLIRDGRVVRHYDISLGRNPEGHKEQEGDKRTPEGRYMLDYKLLDSAFYKAIHISYPNDEDIENARRKNVEPGGKIMIHGQANGNGKLANITQQYDWTSGCIAVTNEDMDEIWKLVEENTPITIEK